MSIIKDTFSCCLIGRERLFPESRSISPSTAYVSHILNLIKRIDNAHFVVYIEYILI